MATESEDKPRRSYWPTLLLIGLVVMPILYFLSFGPAWWLYDHGLLSGGFFIIYKPLYWLAEWFTLFGRLLWWYYRLWGVSLDE